MDLSLTRIDLVNVDTTSRKSLRLLPLGKKNPGKTQKVVVGDRSGSVSVFGMKRGDVSVVFKGTMEKGVSCIDLGGTLDERDKIFAAAGQTIKAWSRKGKEFLKFNTNLSEDISSMFVLNEDIYTGGEYIYNHFRDCKDAHFLMANDRINDLVAVYVTPGALEPNPVLGCQDRTVRVLHDSDIMYEGTVDGPVLTIAQHSSKAGTASNLLNFNTLDPNPAAPSAAQKKNPAARPGAELVYGTENGIVGQLLLDENAMRRGWQVGGRSLSALGAKSATRRGGVTAISSHDITHDGTNDLLIGRDDGTVQVFSFDVAEEPKLCFESALVGSVTAVHAGLVNSPSFDEVVVSTYSGHILSFSSEPSSQIDFTGEPDDGAAADNDEGEKVGKLERAKGVLKSVKSIRMTDKEAKAEQAAIAAGADPKKMALDKRVRAMRKEIEATAARIEQEKARYMSQISEDMIAVQADVKLRDTFALAEDEACYRLSIELSKPLDFVLLQSDVPMDVLDSMQLEAGGEIAGRDESSAIVSRTVGQANSLLATYRVTDKSTRIEVRLRTIEGRYGNLQAYVVPKGQPKTAQAASYSIRPLSLHRRLQVVPEDASTRPMSELRLTGSFSLAEMHSWVVMALPEVPERVQEDEVSYVFRSTFLGTFLFASYRKGDATFRSDNLTTLTTLKEMIGREATQRKVQIKTAYDVKDEAVVHMLKLIHPMLGYQNSLSHKVKLIDTLKEIEQQEDDVSFLDPSYLDILANAATIRSEFAQMPRQLDYLINIVVDLYIDKYKFRGINVVQRLPLLDRLLRTEYSLDAMLQFFSEL